MPISLMTREDFLSVARSPLGRWGLILLTSSIVFAASDGLTTAIWLEDQPKDSTLVGALTVSLLGLWIVAAALGIYLWYRARLAFSKEVSSRT